MVLFTNMVRFFNTSGLNYYNKIFNTIEFINTNICNDVAFDILENINIDPEYIVDGPIKPLENEEYPSPSETPLHPENTSVDETSKTKSNAVIFQQQPQQPLPPPPPIVIPTKPLSSVATHAKPVIVVKKSINNNQTNVQVPPPPPQKVQSSHPAPPPTKLVQQPLSVSVSASEPPAQAPPTHAPAV